MFQVTPLGLDEEWKGGNMEGPGGGFKVNLLREAIKPFKDEKDTIILFTDRYYKILIEIPSKYFTLFFSVFQLRCRLYHRPLGNCTEI